MTIVDEPKVLRYEEINGVKVPVYSAKTETTIMNKKTNILLFKFIKKLLKHNT